MITCNEIAYLNYVSSRVSCSRSVRYWRVATPRIEKVRSRPTTARIPLRIRTRVISEQHYQHMTVAVRREAPSERRTELYSRWQRDEPLEPVDVLQDSPRISLIRFLKLLQVACGSLQRDGCLDRAPRSRPRPWPPNPDAPCADLYIHGFPSQPSGGVGSVHLVVVRVA
jgi:hypothetical protein